MSFLNDGTDKDTPVIIKRPVYLVNMLQEKAKSSLQLGNLVLDYEVSIKYIRRKGGNIIENNSIREEYEED